ncbi:MAG: hypothetical protein ABW133_06460 [Polyangiaceae bacterium]
MKGPIRAIATGALAFLTSQLLLVSRSNSGARWFLNSSADIWKTLVALALVAISIQMWERANLPTRPLWMAVGVALALVAYLFTIGPGNLFPIVIVMGLGMVVPTVVVAGYIGSLAAELVRKT